MTDTTPADRAAWGLWCLLIAVGLQGLALTWPWVDLGVMEGDNPLWAAGLFAVALVILGACELWGATGALMASSRRNRGYAIDADRELEKARAEIVALRSELADMRCQAAGLEGLARSAMRDLGATRRLDTKA